MQRRQWIGIAFIIGGIVLLLNAVGILALDASVLTWWPVLIIAFGIRTILRRPEHVVVGLVVIAVGCLLLADNIIPGFEFWVAAVPVLLIVLGIGIMLRPSKLQGSTTTSVAFIKSESTLSDELISIVAVFSNAEHRITSHHFRGGTIEAVFSNVELDFRSAQLATREASVDVEAVFSSVELLVPPTWRVVVEGTPLFGSIENKTSSLVPSDAPQLTVRSSVVFGSIEIR